MKKKYYLFELKTNTLNIVSVALLVLMILLTMLIVDSMEFNLLISLILLFPYFFLHEILHSIAYVIHGAKYNRVTYGIHLEKGIMCCLCKQNISKKNILISLLYPFIFLGILTYILGIVFNNGILVLLSICNISGCSGDLVMFYDLLKLKDFEYAEYDNPFAFGLYTKNDLSKKKLFGLKHIGSKDKLEQNDLKKISISKASIITFIIFAVVIILYYLKRGSCS